MNHAPTGKPPMTERERRRARRARVTHGATIDFIDQPISIDCTVSDLSSGGARLQTEHAEHVPHSFEIAVNDSNEVYPAKRVWYADGQIGVTFVESKDE
ncbi:MAG TPA: PilZ domain-containing protein [Afifellaceae bacterium]|nr:PilZ domain-containing protein [Afifellaceae bacterium]